MKAKDSAIVEHHRLRSLYRSDMISLMTKKSRRQQMKDWTLVIVSGVDDAQNANFSNPQQRPKRSYKIKS